MFAAFMPLDLPHEASETDVKVAAANAAQATANAAQDVADGCRKEANEAIAGGADPMADTQKIDIRERAKDATESVIHLLRKINSSQK